MRRFVLILVLLLAGCSDQPVPALPTITVPPKATPVALPTLLESPERWIGRPVVLVAPVDLSGSSAVVVAGFHYAGEQLQAIKTAQPALWLTGAIPDGVKSQLAGGLGYLKLRGQLGPPGAYGPDAGYPYQFSVSGAGVLLPETTTLTNLTTNAGALNDVLITVAGTLLTTKDAALLTEETGSGGIPRNDAHQIKLHGLPEPQIVSRLAGSGDVHYGPAHVVGWWHGGILSPFAIKVAP